MDKLTEKQLEETTVRVSRDMALALNDDEAIELVRGVIAALPKPDPDAWRIRFKSGRLPDGLLDVHYHGTNAIADYRQIDPEATCDPLYTAAPLAPPASEQKPRFECWSTNEGDSWYESPEDADLLYDVLGDSPKVGDEFEVMAGWYSVPARYRIASQTDDDFEVECISHPEDNAAHRTNQKTQLDTLLTRLEVISEVNVISSTYDRIRTERIFAADDLEYDLFAAGMKTAIEMMKGGA